MGIEIVGVIVLVHFLAIYAVFFTTPTSATLVAAAVALLVTGLGITIGFHRYFCHHAFKAGKATAYTLAILGSAAFQGPLRWWVGHHRCHHRNPDGDGDPYDARQGFWYPHLLWLLGEDWDVGGNPNHPYAALAKDIAADPFLRFWSKRWVYFSVHNVFLPLGLIAGFGFDAFLWLFAVRLVVTWHITFAVNSAAHRWGYRNYETDDRSTNNPLVGFLAFGEGWHNNHHAKPSLAQHGHKWWEFDLSWQVIQLMAWLGLITGVKRLRRSESSEG